MKITTHLRINVIGILVFAFGTLGSVYLNTVGNDSRVVNHAGIVRGATQRLVKLEMAGQESDKLIAKLDKIVNGLINGDQELQLPPATDPDFLQKMQQVKGNWENLKKNIEEVRNNPAANSTLLKNSEDYFELTNEAVFSAENFSTAKVKRMRTIQFTIFAIDMTILSIIWLLTRNITSTLTKSVNTLAKSSNQINSTVAEQERIVNYQASAVHQTTTTMDELEASSRQAAEQAQASESGARQALMLAEYGAKSAQETIKKMSALKERVKEVSEEIVRLNKQTGQIANISDLVSDISHRTNILAIRVATTASRAGENGKELASVAEEIRQLADESEKSTEKIANLVTNIQGSMKTTISAIEEGASTTDESLKITQGTAKNFLGVMSSVKDVALNSQQISLSAKQQALAVQQVLESMKSLNSDSQTTAAGINQVRITSEHLKSTANKLQAIV